MYPHTRVSTILSYLFPYEGIDQDVLEAKAQIGTNVHKAIISDCADDFVVFETPRAEAYFESYKRWNVAKSNIIQIPRLFCDNLMITGECDGLLENHTLIDWKCSANPHLEQWNMQAHFYWYLLKENGYSISENMLWINLRHRKRIKYKENGQNELIYDPLDPVVYEFKFDENVLDKCIEATIRYHEDKSNAKVLA